MEKGFTFVIDSTTLLSLQHNIVDHLGLKYCKHIITDDGMDFDKLIENIEKVINHVYLDGKHEETLKKIPNT